MLFGEHCPPTICNDLSRIKFDANRNEPEATFNVPEAMCAFQKYMSDIDNATNEIHHAGHSGLFIDIHGHGHRLSVSFHLSLQSVMGNFVSL